MRGTLKYLNGSKDLKLTYNGTMENTKENVKVTFFSDANYGGNKENRRS